MENDQFHAIIARMERFEARMDATEKALTDFRTEVRGRFDSLDRRLEGQEGRLAGKASNVVVSSSPIVHGMARPRMAETRVG